MKSFFTKNILGGGTRSFSTDNEDQWKGLDIGKNSVLSLSSCYGWKESKELIWTDFAINET